MAPETIPISKFKATCWFSPKQVKKKGEPILITLKGEPVAMVVPPPAAKSPGHGLEPFEPPAGLWVISSCRPLKSRNGRFSGDETLAGHPYPA